jgi:hypothetical protein
MINETGWWLPNSDQISRREFSREFLRREIGIRLFSGEAECVHQLNRVRNGQKALVFVDSSVTDLRSLHCFPERSIILFILSDETYNLKLNLRALVNKRVFAIVRDYPLGKFIAIRNLPRMFLGKLIRTACHPSLLKLIPRAVASAFYMSLVQILFRYMSILNRKPVLEMPLGYDSGFCEQFVGFHELGMSESLLEYSAAPENYPNLLKKANNFYFSGQRGTLDRRLMLMEARRVGIEIQSIHDSYQVGRSVESQNTYFMGLRNSRFSLCPPGNYSHRTFRFCESLLLYSYPIVERFTLSDPLSEIYMRLKWDEVFARMKTGKFQIELDESLQYEIEGEIRKLIRRCSVIRKLIKN